MKTTIHHSKNAELFLKDKEKAEVFDKSIWYLREKRDYKAKSISEWEELREVASQIKKHTLSKLPEYLLQFEENAKKLSIKIHWADTAARHNEIVYKILKEKDAHLIVKSKSMLTEECGMNKFLEEKGLEIVDTDLGERIIQLNNERPSHIVMPAVHKTKEEIGELFYEKLKTGIKSSDPAYLTGEARKHLRQKFLGADAALSGVNFAIASTGEIVVCTNEGNADMGINATNLHIASMGIEKIVPDTESLGVFTRLLARSATGQAITTYTSHYGKPREGAELHVIIVDNGRSKILSDEQFWTSLKCIRCGACMNTCPVFRRSGGHAYMFTTPGPIGSVLAPNYDALKYKELPFASTLCGSCSDVCPVKIEIHELLYKWRQELTKRGEQSFPKGLIMKLMGTWLSSFFLYKNGSMLIKIMLKLFRGIITRNPLNSWGKSRELPDIPAESFKKWYLKNKQ